MLRTLLFLVFVVSLGSICSEAKRRLNGTRTNCAKFGTRNSTREVCIKQYGRSGKFSISVGRRGEDDPRTITLEFDRIGELGRDGKEIANTEPRSGKHSFKNFANLDFEYSNLTNTSYKGIEAYGFNFSVSIPGPNATLNVPIFIFKKDATINLCDDEEIIIKRGMVKYNIELSGWRFCGQGGTECKKGNKDEIGEFAEFVMVVKYNGKAVQGEKQKKKPGMRRKAMKFFFGNKTISFPGAVVSDGVCKGMSEDYPKLGKKVGSKFPVHFRFPKFSRQVIYDPAVNVLDDENPPPEESDSAGAHLIGSLGVVIMLGFLARLF